AAKVTQASAAANTINGTFSHNTFGHANRLSGHTSKSNSTNGNVTSMGFAISPSANNTATAAYRPLSGRSAYSTYAYNAAKNSAALSTSFLSATHATDSTCNGCNAKIPATNALAPRAPVARFKTANSSSVAAKCHETLTR